MSLTVNCIPQTPQVATKSALPFGISVQPLRPSEPLPIADFGVGGIVRCSQCRAYINPFATFIDGGRRWRCPFCDNANDVPSFYYNSVDHMGVRMDLDQRPELVHCACEFVATADYIRRAPQPPVYTFVIDVSSVSINNGLALIAADVISKTLDHLLLVNEMTRIAFVTYDTAVHLYNFQTGSNQPTMMVLNQVNDLEIPHGYPFLALLKDVKTSVENFLAALPKMFANSKASQACLGSAAQAALHVQKSLGGKMIIISSLPPTVGRGICNPSFDNKLLGTPKETTVLTPSVDFYKSLGLDCSKYQVSVEYFLCSSGHHDAASLSIASTMTGGAVHHFPNWNLGRDAVSFGSQLQNLLTMPRGWESVMRARCSSGLEIQQFHGNLHSENDLIVFPVLDANKSVALRLKHTAAIDTARRGHFAYFQAGILYTSDTSERRIRVYTTCVPISDNLNNLYSACNPETMVHVMSKVAIQHALKTKLIDSREVLVNQLQTIIQNYKQSNPGVMSGDLSLPASLQSLPLYILALVKNIALRPTFNVQPDDRIAGMDYLRTASIEMASVFIYPRLYSLANMPDECGVPDSETGLVTLPPLENLTITRLQGGIFLMDDGVHLILWFSVQSDPSVLIELFGTPHLENVATTQITSWPYNPELDATCLYNRIASTITQITFGRLGFQKFVVCREGDVTHASIFLPALVEDRQLNMHSYFEFVQQLQRTSQS
eukprot:TRINITY_DN719_c0_g1_i2.p1 TRINITY_DN719_c0_g1~~TRINITY_DN719_c0_g1_i2.p1  ORF type:complete len:720 (-),score=122.31 TRINITY_DN719_c0_g1_i2:32-2191(-)